LQPVPAGTSGELFIGGAGLARGYLNNEELTHEKFIADPFSSDPNAKLYRTGDRVREFPDGTLEFLGRFDDQVKILGHRIEPGEIEAVLRQLPEVRQAAVVTKPGLRSEKQLVAYVVLMNAGSKSFEQLQRSLAERLPHFMVPNRIVQLESLPLNANGKVDRSALPWPVPLQVAPGAVSSGVPEFEQRLTALWSRILRCQVGRDDNFFDLGGTSLQLIEVHSELNKILGRELRLTDFFEHSTVRTLANHLTGEATNTENVLSSTADRAERQRAAFARRRRTME
jgi:acyl carrier protein